jgi:hypothetical protein
VDGLVESRRGTVSVFNGPPPAIEVVKTERQEIEANARWIAERLAEGYQPQEIGLFVRSEG